MTDAKRPLQATSTLPRFQITLRFLSLILVVIGIIVSSYLSYSHLSNTSVVCVEGSEFDCGLVQSSVYSKLFGVPIAYLGLLTYLMLGALLLLEDRSELIAEYGTIMIFGITLFAFLYSIWLVYVQVFILQALCQWCLTHEVVMTILFVVSSIRLKHALSEAN
jgi:uncharacterized membrane protein